MPVYQCRICLAKLEIKGKERNITFDSKLTPYGGPYPHRNTLECPLVRGLPEEELARLDSVKTV